MSATGIKLDQAMLRNTISRLEGFESKVRRRVNRKAVTAAAKIYRDQTRSEVPVNNGYLKKSITYKVKSYGRGKYGWAGVGQNIRKLEGGTNKRRKREKGGGISGRGDVVPSHLVEFPTAPHVQRLRSPRMFAFTIEGRTGKGRRSRKRDVNVFTHRIRHPGTSGRFYIQKAAIKAKQRAQRVMNETLRKETLKAARS